MIREDKAFSSRGVPLSPGCFAPPSTVQNTPEFGGHHMSARTVPRPLVRPAVWVGRLACYNEGNLLGQWFPAERAGEVTPEDLHGSPTAHEELWCLDHEGFPAHTGEMPPLAAAWGGLFDEVGEAQWLALLAWVENGAYVVGSDGLPDLSSFEDRYRGCWDSFGDYLAEQIDEMQWSWPDEAAYERDARFDYEVIDAPEGEVFISVSC